MSANVEMFGNRAAFASLRRPAWWDLDGAYTVDKPLPILKFAAKANLLGWDVRKENLADVLPEYRFLTPAYVNVRTNPFDGGIDVLGTVGERYFNYQNEDLAALAQTFGSGDYRAETMGSLNGGRTVFMAFVHPDDIVIDPKGAADHIKRYVLLAVTFDGTGAVTGRKCNTRVECNNTLNMAFGESKPEISARHTRSMHDRIAAAVKLAGWADDFDAEFQAGIEKLYAADMTTSQFWNVVKDEFPEPEKDVKGNVKKWTDKTDTLVSVWNGGTGSMPNLPQNAYRALQTFTEVNQWNRQLRSDNTDNAYAAGAGFDNVTNAYRQRITDKLLATVA